MKCGSVSDITRHVDKNVLKWKYFVLVIPEHGGQVSAWIWNSTETSRFIKKWYHGT